MIDDMNEPERALSLAYLAPPKRSAARAIWALDAQFADVVRSTTEPLIGEMRLTWWHDAVKALGEGGRVPDEPLLQRLSAELTGTDVDFAALAEMADGWSPLIDPLPLTDEALNTYAQGRGAALFGQLGALLGNGGFAGLAGAGAGWALTDFALRCTDRDTASRALASALPLLEQALAAPWPGSLRPIGMLAVLALRDARAGLDAPQRQGAPGRMLRMIRHKLTGR